MRISSRRIAIDTGVWVESILVNSEYYHLARTIRTLVEKGRIIALITPLTTTEVYYVSYRVYRRLGLSNEEAIRRAERFFELLYTSNNVEVIINSEVAKQAATIKLEYNLALSDCYLLAVSRILNVPALFRHVEREMEPIVSDLRREFNIYFLSDFS